MATLAIDAPAKINLALHVTGRRADGYHLIDTLVVFARLGDRIELCDSPSDTFVVCGPFAEGLPTDGGNLVLKARDRLRRAAGAERAGPVSIRLEKNLPVASGIGGGSSDAAAALRGLRAVWQTETCDEALSSIGIELGADLPMCLSARPLRARGVGEAIEPVAGWPGLHLVLVNPGVAVATADIFSRLERRENTPLPALPEQRDHDALCVWLETTRNDLEAPARLAAPVIGEVLDALRSTGAGVARMSGSGATCFGMYRDAEAARSAAATLAAQAPGWFIAATESRGSEP